MKQRELYTFAGLPLEKALKELDRLLPPAAYRPISGGSGQKAGLTDISPSYSMELINELFGPVGLGWGYEELEFMRDGAYCAVKLRVWYTLYNETGELTDTVELTARGGNSNGGNREWAEKGALTNALGAAWSLVGLQSSVYKGLRGHETVAEEWRRLNGKQADAAAPATPEPATEPEKLVVAAVKPAVVKADDCPAPLPVSPAAVLKASNVKFRQSDDGLTIYALPDFNNPSQRRAVTDIGGKWNPQVPADTHQLKNRSGAYVILLTQGGAE